MNNYYKNIPGWFSDNEAVGLYDSVNSLKNNNSILEIGFLFGRSTSIICDAISTKENIKFDSYDINFKNEEEFYNFYDNIHGRIPVPDLLLDTSFKTNTSILDIAMYNLKSINLLKFVNLQCGNFHEIKNKTYDLIFCDALHDENEIKINLPKILELSNKNATLCFHDMIPNNLEIIKKTENLKYLKIYDSLAIFLKL